MTPRTPPTPRRRAHWLRISALVAAALVGAAACAPPDRDAAAPTGCAATVREASREAEVAAQIRLLDDALLACRSFDALTRELDRYPSSIGYDSATFVSLRCERVDDEAIRTSPACESVIATTTVPTTTLPDLVFVGDTLDGRRVEIRPTETVEFVGAVPAVVQQTVDIALESGCDGVIEQRDLWAALIDDPVTGDEASVYAQHAQNVADYIDCESAPLEIG